MFGRGRRGGKDESIYELMVGAVGDTVCGRPVVGTGGVGRSEGVSRDDDGGVCDGVGVRNIGEDRRMGVEVGSCCVAD